MILSAYAIGQWSDTERVIASHGSDIRIADGDSFSINGTRLRLDGIDAPEYHQNCIDNSGKSWPCGKAARESLLALLSTAGLICDYRAADRYGRLIATCSTRAVPDIAAAQVRNGFAVSQIFYGLRQFGVEEDAARAARRGLWSGSFETPQNWRASHPAPVR